MVDMKEFGDLFAQFRRNTHDEYPGPHGRQIKGPMSQERLGKSLGVEKSTVHYWEQGRNLPNDRSVCVDAIREMAIRGGVANPEAANRLLGLADWAPLNEDEVHQCFPGQQPVIVESGQTSSLKEALKSYCDAVASRHMYLDVTDIPVQGEKPVIKLDDIFVPLNAVPKLPRVDFFESQKEFQQDADTSSIRDEAKWIERQIEKTQPVAINRALSQHKHMVILGLPGAGKTTLLHHLAFVFASGLAKEKLLIGEELVPIYLSLSQLRDESPDHLYDLSLEQAINTVPDIPGSSLRLAIQEAISQGKVLFLLDALDETYGKRSDFARNIGFLIGRYKQNRFIVTSRIVGYPQIGGSEHLQHYTVLDFTVSDKERFVKKWYKALAKTHNYTPEEIESWAGEKTKWLLNEIDQKQQLSELTANPLHLVMYVILSQDTTKLPTDWVELYSDYLWRFLKLHQDWEAQKGRIVGGQVRSLEALEVLYEASYALYCSLDNNEISTTWENICRQIYHRLKQKSGFGLGSGRSLDMIQSDLDFWWKAGLVTRDEWIGDKLDFRYKAFQEYGAAYVLASDLEEHERRKKEDVFQYGDHWKEVRVLIPVLRSRTKKLDGRLSTSE